MSKHKHEKAGMTRDEFTDQFAHFINALDEEEFQGIAMAVITAGSRFVTLTDVSHDDIEWNDEESRRCAQKVHGMQQRRTWIMEANTLSRGWCWVPFLEPEPDLPSGIRSLLNLRSGCWRIRNIETDDTLTFDQAQTIISFDFPLIPEVLEPFFTANRKALNTGGEGTRNPE